MEEIVKKLEELAVSYGGRLVGAIVVLIVGNLIVKAVVKRMKNGKMVKKVDSTVATFSVSLVKLVLYALLVVIIIGILGIPMTSVIAVLTAAAATIGLALQGALSNLAGGIMIMIFKPFRVGDYVDAGGASGNVMEITVFYTIINTLDNKRVSIPNGSLMNSNVTNYSAEPLRRVDLDFCAAFGTDSSRVVKIITEAARTSPLIIEEGAEPVFAKLSGYKDNSVKFTLRAWCKNADYWATYFDLIERVNDAFAANQIAAPSTHVNVTQE